MSQTYALSHSADVQIWLVCGRHGRLALNRVTPKSVVAERPRDIPPCEAELVVTVDGVRVSNLVKLVTGFSPHRRAALIQVIDPIPF